MLIALVACMADDWTGVPWQPADTGGTAVGAPSPLIGAWVSSGEDVSDLLAGPPFYYVSVDATFDASGTYTVDATDTDGGLWPVRGSFDTTAGSPGTVLLAQTEPYEAEAIGIWQVEGDVLQWEVVQTVPDYGFTPPTPETGFGSSAGGGLVTGANLQTYRRP